MTSRGSNAMKDILQKALSVSRELDALQREHHSVLSGIKGPGSRKFADCAAPGVDPSRPGEEFEDSVNQEKVNSLNLSLKSVQKGIEETQLMVMVANYISSLEADKLKLRAQVKRLCAENNWLRESLTESQQLLQQAEVSLEKLKVDKEHLEFIQNQCGVSQRASADHYMEQDDHESEIVSTKEGVPVTFPMGLPDTLINDMTGIDTGLDYETPEKIKLLHQLALQHVHQGKPEVAIPLCRKAVQEMEQKVGRNNPDLATLLNILAVIYREQGRFKEAICVLQDTLDIRENVFGTTHAAVASTLNNLSVLHGKCGDFKTAEPFCQRALEIRQALLGTDHPDVAKQFCNLAVLSSNLGRYDEVEHYYLRALEIFQLELGVDDPNITKTMNNLANCYLKQGKYKAAEAMFKKVLKTVHTEANTTDLHSRQAHRETVSSKESPQIGEPGYWHKLTPVQSPTVNDTLRCLTDTYRGQGRLEDAAELEMLAKEKHLAKEQKERISQIFGEQLSNNSVSDTTTKSHAPGLQNATSSKASLTWKWVVGQRSSQHQYSNLNAASSRHPPK